MTTQDNETEYRSGAALLSAFGTETREQKLERACKAMMTQLDDLHVHHKKQSLAGNVENHGIFCSCADAYRMGHEALKP